MSQRPPTRQGADAGPERLRGRPRWPGAASLLVIGVVYAVLREGLIWIANVVTFAVWYWAIDEGGPGRRHPDAHESEDFQFPQDQDGASGWSPDFADYLFLAFNQSTAFGPTDTSVMSKRAKVLSMTQAFFSLLIIAVVVARATAQ